MPLSTIEAAITWSSNNTLTAAGSRAFVALAPGDSIPTGAAVIQLKADVGAGTVTSNHLVECKLLYQVSGGGYDTYQSAPVSHVLDLFDEFQDLGVTAALGSMPMLFPTRALLIEARFVDPTFDPGANIVTMSARWTYQTLT